MYRPEPIPAPFVTATRADIQRIIHDGPHFAYSHPSSGSPLKGAIDTLRTNARLSIQWELASHAGLVRLCIVPDDSSRDLDDLIGDMGNPVDWPGGQRALNATRKKAIQAINTNGVYGIIGQYRPIPHSEWISADSIWGCAGYNDLTECDYNWDIMAQTLDTLRAALRARCPLCRQPTPSAHTHT